MKEQVKDISTDLADGYSIVDEGNKISKRNFSLLMLALVGAVGFLVGSLIAFQTYIDSLKPLVGG